MNPTHSVSVVEYIRTSLLNLVILTQGAEIKPFYGMFTILYLLNTIDCNFCKGFECLATVNDKYWSKHEQNKHN